MDAEVPDFAAEGLLDGLEAAAREERRGLLEDLHRAGEPLERLRAATAQGLVAFLPAERAIGGTERYTLAEVAARTGVDEELLRRLRRAQGLPSPDEEDSILTNADVEAASIAAAARTAGIADEDILALSRTLGRGLSQGAEQMRAITLHAVLEPGLGERELAHRFADATTVWAPLAGRLVTALLELHLRQMAQTEAVAAAARVPGAHEVLVGFADLVGFTRVGEQVPADELSRLAGRLEQLTLDLMPAPVRLVKTIGDAVMLVSPEPDAMLGGVLALIDAADQEGEGFPQVHAGVAHGPAVSRAGDWFGRPVNLASRVSGIARPGSVLVTDGVRATVEGPYRFSFAGERRLKGVREPTRLFRARRESLP